MKSDFEMQLKKQYRTRTAKLYISLPFFFLLGRSKEMILIFKAVKSAKYAALFTTKINFMCNVVCHNVFQIGVPKDSIAFKRAVNLGINITGELHGHYTRQDWNYIRKQYSYDYFTENWLSYCPPSQ